MYNPYSPEKQDAYRQYMIWKNGILAQIGQLEAKVSTYEAFKQQVQGLKEDLAECGVILRRTYGHASKGISCIDFDANIGKIYEYAIQMGNSSATLEGVIEDINSEINQLNNKISQLRSLIS